MMIRLAEHKDMDQLVRMRWDFTNEYAEKKIEEIQYEAFYRECRSFFSEVFNGDKWFIWVADIEGQILPHVYIQLIDKVPRPGRKTNPFLYMTNVYTLPDCRRKGIGSQILKEIEKWSKDNDYEFIIVWPSDWSVDFYERNGYSLCKEPMELVLD